MVVQNDDGMSSTCDTDKNTMEQQPCRRKHGIDEISRENENIFYHETYEKRKRAQQNSCTRTITTANNASLSIYTIHGNILTHHSRLVYKKKKKKKKMSIFRKRTLLSYERMRNDAIQI